MLRMKKTFLFASLALAAAGVLLTSGCVVRERTVYRSAPAAVGTEVTVTEAPPAPLVETVTIAPGPGFVWVGGGWVWRNHWVWERGHWAHPPRPGAVWVAHRYEYRNGVHVFIRGGWRF
jgi:hypothetical protein